MRGRPRRIAGIDEAGRGPLAGPVAIGCVVIESRAVSHTFPHVRDSKKLSPKEREVWFEKIKELSHRGALAYTAVLVSHRVIDTRGISHAIFRGITKALREVSLDEGARVLLDGGIRAPREFRHQKTIIKGDEKELSIALASVVAKVTRDRHMLKLAQKHPEYGFEVHKGYGTKGHLTAIRKHGLSPVHRTTFCTRV